MIEEGKEGQDSFITFLLRSLAPLWGAERFDLFQTSRRKLTQGDLL